MANQFSSDEIILALVSLVRTIDAGMLRQGPEGFTIDLERVEKKTNLSDDERLLLKLRTAMATPGAEGNYEVELAGTESRRLAETLAQLEKVGDWAADVLQLSRELRARLLANA